MAVVSEGLYVALLKAGAPQEEASEAAREMAVLQRAMSAREADQVLFYRMGTIFMAVATAGVLALVIKAFT
jgi:hypothetical protein